MTVPLVTMLMPVHNAAPFLDAALESALGQTFRDFELVIIEDGSTDRTPEMLKRYEARDCRIRLRRQSHRGFSAALNAGIELARGRYLVRIDADDLSDRCRIAEQVRFMDERPDIGISGTWVRTIGEIDGQVWRYPTDDASIRCHLLFHSALADPSVIIRRDLFSPSGPLRYLPEYSPAEDFECWIRASEVTRFANLPRILVAYRIHGRQTSQRSADRMRATTDRICLMQLRRLGLDPSEEELALHRSLPNGRFEPTHEALLKIEAWLRTLQAANRSERRYPEPRFSAMLADYWFRACRAASALGPRVWRIHRKSPLAADGEHSFMSELRFGVRCALGR